MQGLKTLLLLPQGGRQDGVPVVAAVVDSLETVLKDTRQHPAVTACRDPWAIHIVSSSWVPQQRGQCCSHFPPLPSQLPIQRPPACEIVLFVSKNYDKVLLSLFRVAQLSLDAAQGTPLRMAPAALLLLLECCSSCLSCDSGDADKGAPGGCVGGLERYRPTC